MKKNYFIAFSIILVISFIGGEAMAQKYFYDHLPRSGVYVDAALKKSNRGKVVWNPSGSLKGNALKIAPDGTISGNIMITGANGIGGKAALSAEQKDLIITNLKAGIARWSNVTTVVCGRSVKLTIDLRYQFIESTDEYEPENMLIYVLDNYSRLNKPTDGAPTLGALHFPYGTKAGAWAQSFEPVRGTGELPAFAMLLIDPEQISKEYPKDPMQYWQLTAAHEFGHALGLFDTAHTTDKGAVPTNESPKGLMNAVHPNNNVVHTEYVAEIMTRVLECRVDVRVEMNKTQPLKPGTWDYKASIVWEWTDALTSEWAYYNSFENNYNENTCTSDNVIEKHMTYRHCTGANENGQADSIDFYLMGGIKVPAYYEWEKNGATPQLPSEDYSALGGEECVEPIKNKNTMKFLSVLDLTLGADGKHAWLLNFKDFSTTLNLEAKDEKPDSPPDCPILSHNLIGGMITAPNNSTGTVVEGEDDLKINAQPVGKVNIGITLRLAPKKGF